jgi:hypothetical protein
MAREKSSAPHAHPSIEDHDDIVEAHYACLERPHACMDGWVFLGRVVESEHDLDGEVVEYERVPCRCCAESPAPQPRGGVYGATHSRGNFRGR